MKLKTAFILSVTGLAVLVGLTACSDPSTSKAKLDPAIPEVSLSELVKNPASYAGKSVTVSGRFAGMCGDGADFFFKDKLDIIEVIPPVDGLPQGVVIGTPLKVQGKVAVRSEHAKPSPHSGEKAESKESEVKVVAAVVQIVRAGRDRP